MLRLARRTLATSHRGVRPSLRLEQPDVADPFAAVDLLVDHILPIKVSPGRGLNGLRSTSQLRRRTPSPSSSAIRAALTKMRRRWLEATKPVDPRRLDRCGRERRRCPRSCRSRRRRRRAAGDASPGMRRSARLPCSAGYPLTPNQDRRHGDGRQPVPARSSSAASTCDQRVAVGDAATPFGEGVVGEVVGDVAVGVMVPPPSPRDRREAGPHPLGDLDRAARDSHGR